MYHVTQIAKCQDGVTKMIFGFHAFPTSWRSFCRSREPRSFTQPSKAPWRLATDWSAAGARRVAARTRIAARGVARGVSRWAKSLHVNNTVTRYPCYTYNVFQDSLQASRFIHIFADNIFQQMHAIHVLVEILSSKIHIKNYTESEYRSLYIYQNQ